MYKKINYNEIFSKFKIKPNNFNLYRTAFIHPSYSKKNNYQKLEFIGDSILNSIIAILAYHIHPELDEGHLTRLRSSLVNTIFLNKIALKYNFNNYIKFGASFKDDITKSPKILEDVFEAFIGAVYLDNNFDFTFKLIKNIFNNYIINFNYEHSIDFKSKLQELFQSKNHNINELNYKLMKRSFLNKKPYFKVSLFRKNIILGSGSGSSKKKAEQEAAKNALNKYKNNLH